MYFQHSYKTFVSNVPYRRKKFSNISIFPIREVGFPTMLRLFGTVLTVLTRYQSMLQGIQRPCYKSQRHETIILYLFSPRCFTRSPRFPGIAILLLFRGAFSFIDSVSTPVAFDVNDINKHESRYYEVPCGVVWLQNRLRCALRMWLIATDGISSCSWEPKNISTVSRFAYPLSSIARDKMA